MNINKIPIIININKSLDIMFLYIEFIILKQNMEKDITKINKDILDNCIT